MSGYTAVSVERKMMAILQAVGSLCIRILVILETGRRVQRAHYQIKEFMHADPFLEEEVIQLINPEHQCLDVLS